MTEQLMLYETYSALIADCTSFVGANKNLDAVDLRLRIKGKIDSAKEACNDYSPECIRSAEFAVCAALDEFILAKNSLGSAEWRKNLLQDAYFNTTDAGILFFTRCEKLTDQQPDLLHLYFFCLATGFRGQYYSADGNDAILIAMKSLLSKMGDIEQEQLLLNQGLLVDSKISSNSVRTLANRFLHFRGYLWIVIPLLIFLGVYSYFYFSILNSVRFYLAAAS